MASGRTNDLTVLLGMLAGDLGRVNDLTILTGVLPPDLGRANDLSVLVSYVPPTEGIKIIGTLIEYAVSELDSDCSLAGLPDTYMIFPDPKLTRSSVASVTSQSGPGPGDTVSASANLGRLLPVQSGTYQVAAEDLVLKLQEGGGVDKATYVWKQDSEADTEYRGVDDPRYWWGFHDANRGALIGPNNSTAVYHRLSNRIFLYTGKDVSGTGKIAVGYRTPEQRYDDWTFTTTQSTEKTFVGSHNMAAIELPDGRIMVVQRVDGDPFGPAKDFDVYHSEDGLTFTRVSKSIVERFDTSTAAVHNNSSQIRLAISGEYIRLCFVDTSDNLITYVSQDRGISWKRLTDSNNLTAISFTIGDTGDTDDNIPFDIEGVNDNGNFVLVYLSSGTAYTVVRLVGNQDQDWSAPGTLSFDILDTSIAIKAICMVRGPTYLWVFLFAYDVTLGQHAWTMIRVKREDYLKLGAEWQKQDRSEYDGTEEYPGRIKAIWAGSQVVFWGSAKTEAAGTDTSDGSCWMMGGWTNRSLGSRLPSDDFATYTAKDLMPIWWVAQQLEPSASTNTTWTKATVGAGAGSGQQNHLVLTGTNAADAVNYTYIFGSDPGWGFAGGAVVYPWEVSVDSGDSTHTAADVSVEIKSSDGTDQWSVTIQHGPTTTRLIDNVAASTVGDLSITIDNDSTQLTRFRLAVDEVSGVFTAQLSALNYTTGLWVTISGTITTAVTTGTSIKFGHLGQVQATQMRSYWREMAAMIDGVTPDETPGLRELGFTNPDDLIGQVCGPSSAPPMQLENGTQVAWAGAGGAAGDEFDIDIAYTFGVASMLTDSPRLDWRSGGADPQVAQTIIFDAGATGVLAHLWTHDSIMLVGTTDREIIIDYDSSLSFTVPIAGGTVSMDAFNTGNIALTVSSIANQHINIDTSSVRFTEHELASTSAGTYYVRVISGSALGKTWKITEHPELGRIVVGEEESLSAQGLAPSDKLVIFADRGAVKYSNTVTGCRYMRLRMLETDTATGDHRIGAIIPNMHHTLSVPLEWAHTDNEQPNITNYRTRGAIQWAYEEGPPQRTLTSRIVGDVTQRERDQLRFQMRLAGYELRPIAMVIDSDRPVGSALYGRIVSGSQFDNAAYYVDSNGVVRPAGDMSFQFVEEK